ncbi:16S rRNA (uracil(1498)-N(3))-methyltransferase [Lachnospiraceae bacterium 54-53]
MHHFFVNQDQVGPDAITITGPDVNHIKNVLRMGAGEQVLISNGVDRDYVCELAAVTSEEVTARIISVDEGGRELPAKLFLFQGLPKGDKMELIIQKAVELGVYRIIPMETKRTVVKLDKKKEEAKLRRFAAVSESAAKQSGRLIVPEVAKVMTFREALTLARELDFMIIPFEHAKNMAETREVLYGIKPGMSAGIFIGPEGGFEDSEVELAETLGARQITLGRRILRTETAGLAVLSVLAFHLEGF